MSAKDVQRDAQVDAQLELKKRARRRLVGAIALAVLAAIVLPMVMDQEPKPTSQDIQIRIPSQDAGSYTSRILPVKPGATATPLPTAVPDPKPAETAKSADVAQPASEIKPALESKPAPKAEKPADKSAAKPVEKVVERVVEKADKVGEKAAAKPNDKAEQAKLVAALNGAAELWVVQLGAYRDPANVSNLQAKLKAQGYHVYTEALDAPDGSKKIRVRAGPFANKEAAEKARERIKRIGVDGVVAQKQ